MPGYNYGSDYEKYEGTYTANEIELNSKLIDECTKDKVNFEVVEDLLKQGADPLGATAAGGIDIFEHIYDDIITESCDTSSVNLPKLTELFLQYGMNIDKPRIPYDDMGSANPIWSFTFVPNENSIKALKMLLDNGMSADSFAKFWDHSMTDYITLGFCDPEADEFEKKSYTWTFKMILLGASYDHILNEDECLRENICYSDNTSDVHMFRNWNDFEYKFDASHCNIPHDLYGLIIHIYSKETKQEVWTISV